MENPSASSPAPGQADGSNKENDNDQQGQKKIVTVNSADVAELKTKFADSLAQTNQMYLSNYGELSTVHNPSRSIKFAVKISDEFEAVRDMPAVSLPSAHKKKAAKKKAAKKSKSASSSASTSSTDITQAQDAEELSLAKNGTVATANDSSTIDSIIKSQTDGEKRRKLEAGSGALVTYQQKALANIPAKYRSKTAELILRQRQRHYVKPEWHAPWKLYRVLQGHLGHVRCVGMDPANEFFVTGSNDRCIKIWDIASGSLKLTLTGHISAVMGVVVSPRHPYLFSVGQDKTVKCWDLEYNKVIRSYHGHLSGVYTCNLHPTLDVLMTGGRDSTCRVWDIRTKAQVRVLSGHKHTVEAIDSQGVNPQVITGSHDSTVRLWDLGKGACMATLTNHKKSVRSLKIHPKEFTFATASTDNMKVWKCPEGRFIRNISGHQAIINSIAINNDNVMVSAADNGSMKMWDWKSGYCFQDIKSVVQPGSMENENGIFDVKFDMTGSRMITAECDKTIKMWKEDPDATPETHPIDFKVPKKRKRY